MRHARALAHAFAALALACVTLLARPAAAGSKEECIDAHGRGQDLRDHGQLTRARQVFLTCAQNACPALIQGDCARFGDELERLVPSVSFAARDPRGGDLAATSVYVDDVLVTSRLEEGKSYDVDPGRHVVRFAHDGKEVTLRVVVNQGEKGRALVATFESANAPGARASSDKPAAPPEPSKSAVPLIVAGLGGAAAITGVVVMVLGLNKVPAACSVSTKECAAAPGDPVYQDAQHGVTLANVGLGTAIGGAAVLTGGLLWYALAPADTSQKSGKARVTPWVAAGTGGVAVDGRF